MTRRGRIVWAVWLLLIVASFAVLEGMGWNEGNTLSRFVYDLGVAWPLSIWINGALCGGLAVHFFWHWSPPGSTNKG